MAEATPGNDAPILIRPPGGWSRDAVLDWLLGHAKAGTDMLIGVDLSPGLPFADCGAFFPGWSASPATARQLWRMVDAICADDPHLGADGMFRHPEIARHFRQRGALGELFGPGMGRLRRCEQRMRPAFSPSSCFHLVGARQVGKSSLTGMRVLHRLDGAIPVWPFDPLPDRGPVIVEIYTTMAARAAGIRPGRSKIRDAEGLDAALARLGTTTHTSHSRYDDHATDAIVTAAWLRRHAEDAALWHPTGIDAVAATEGWTFGVT